jgi:hypothetical protein
MESVLRTDSVCFGLLDPHPDPFVTSSGPAPDPDALVRGMAPDPSITKPKIVRKTLIPTAL